MHYTFGSSLCCLGQPVDAAARGIYHLAAIMFYHPVNSGFRRRPQRFYHAIGISNGGFSF
jgi:hypothetical protein